MDAHRGAGPAEAEGARDLPDGGPAVDELSDGELLAWRLHSQRLTGPGFAPTTGGVAAAVRWSGAVQAQDHEPALWSLARRSGCPPLTVPAAAFDAAAFVRTHVLRPTWHLVPREALRPLLALTGPRLLTALAPRWRDLALPPDLLAYTADAVVAAVAADGPLTREGVRAVLAGAGLPADGPAFYHVLMHAELRGLICSGPMRGRQHTYALTVDRVPPQPPVDPDDAARDLAVAYVRGHGPATERDLAWWAGLPLGAVRVALARAEPEVRSLRVRDRRYWVAGDQPPVAAVGSPAVHLLPGYDEYLVAYSESRHLADPHDAASRMPRGGLLSPCLVVDGRVSGSWRRRLVRRAGGPAGAEAVEAVVTCFVPLTPAERAELEVEAERYASVLERPLRLSVLPSP